MEYHLRKVFRKLGVASRTQLARAAYTWLWAETMSTGTHIIECPEDPQEWLRHAESCHGSWRPD